MEYSFILSLIFSSIMLFLAFIDLKTFHKPPHQNYKNIIISTGVLGTFVGILIGLWSFDTMNIEKSVPTLLEGLKTAFITSVVGMTLAIFLSALQKKATSIQEQKDENEALESLKNMSSSIQDGFKKHQESFDSFRKSLDSNQNQLKNSLQNSNKIVSEKLDILSDIFKTNENIEKQLFAINAYSSHFERIDEDIHTMLEMILKEAIHLKINEDSEYWIDIFRRMKEIVEDLKLNELKTKELTEDLEKKSLKVLELQKEINTLKDVISELKQDENETIKNLELKVFDLNKLVENLEDEVSKLRKSCKQKDEQLLNYQPKIDKIEYIQPEMVKVPTGSFIMGSNSGKSDKKPVHNANINYEFYVAKFPVTFDEYDRFCEKTDRKKPADKGWGRENRPVINISWHDTKAYVEWLSKESGEKYRLPSETEWEYFARAGTETNWSFGDDPNLIEDFANCGEKVGRTSEVGNFKSNPWDIYDTYGNVWEWCEDWYIDNYQDKPKDGKPYLDKNTSRKVMRGSAWDTPSGYTRSANRGWNYPQRTEFNIGFRVVKDLIK